MHPNFVAYNPESMLRLRDIAPKVIGCNFDPSHMFWQGVDPVAAIRSVAVAQADDRGALTLFDDSTP